LITGNERILGEYYNTIFYADFVERFKLKSLEVARFIFNFFIQNFSSEFSINKIMNFLSSQGIKFGKETVYEYVEKLPETLNLVGLLNPTEGDVLFEVDEDTMEKYEEALDLNDKDTIEKISKSYSIFKKKGSETKLLRRKMGIVFQDPYSSLDPRMKVLDIIKEPMIATGYMKGKDADDRVKELLEEVGLSKSFAYRYPHELSGGQRQRVAIARALATDPKFVVLDEPTSALDVSVQAQTLNLLKELKRRRNMTMLLITHNIAVVSYMADRVAVMYAGKLMELGDKYQVLKDPRHPYTVALISAVPQPNPLALRNRIILKGDPPSLIHPPRGCVFHPRCPLAFEECGWTANEVMEDLNYLLQSKYYDIFGDRVKIEIKDENSLIISNANIKDVENVIKEEKEMIRSLKSIKVVEEKNGIIEIRLHKFEEPKLYKFENERRVACLLFKKVYLSISWCLISKLQ